MRAIILAAGRGGRLSGITGSLPKCLARVGTSTLIERQVAALRACGVDDITTVVGYRSPDVRRVCGASINIVHNLRFASTNSLYSLWLARDLLAEGFVVLNGDVLFHEQLMADLMTARYEDALLIGARGAHAYSDEEMKVRIRGGQVVEIAKTIDPAEADGENIGIGKFGSTGAAVLVEEMSRLVSAGAFRDWLPAAFGAFCRRRPLYAVESRGFPWIEIDYPEDYWRACGDVLPAINALGGFRAHSPASARDVAAVAAVLSGRTFHHV